MHKTESCRVQLNIVDTVMQRTESLSLSPLIMWPDQCILGWRERGGLMMKERVHKPHPLQIQMSFCLELLLLQDKYAVLPLRDWVCDTNTIWERNGTKLLLFSYWGTGVVHQPPSELLSCTSLKPFQQAPQKRRQESSQMHKLCCSNACKWGKVTCFDPQEPPETGMIQTWVPFYTESGWLCCCFSGHPNQKVPLEWFLPAFPPCCRTMTPRWIL